MYMGTQGLPSWVWRLIYRPPLATFQVFPWCILTFPKSITKWKLKTIKIHWKFASKLTKSTPKGTSKTTSSTLAGQAGAIFEYGKVARILIFEDCNSNLDSDPPILRKRVNPCRFLIILISPRALPRRQAGLGRLALERASFNSKVFSCRFLTLLFLSKKWKKRHVV